MGIQFFSGYFMIAFVSFSFAFLSLAQPVSDVFSANRNFSAEISSGGGEEILVTVFKWNEQTKTVFWSKKLKPAEIEAVDPLTGALVSGVGRHLSRMSRFPGGANPDF